MRLPDHIIELLADTEHDEEPPHLRVPIAMLDAARSTRRAAAALVQMVRADKRLERATTVDEGFTAAIDHDKASHEAITWLEIAQSTTDKLVSMPEAPDHIRQVARRIAETTEASVPNAVKKEAEDLQRTAIVMIGEMFTTTA